MPTRMIIVRAVWDPDASVWVATSNDLPGLVTEAETFDALRAKVPGMAGELLELEFKGREFPVVPAHIIAEHTAVIPNPRAA